MRSNCSGDRDRVRLVDRTDDVDESWLVLHAQAGSREHIERLVLIAQEFLAPRLRAMVAEPADADDVLQDVLFTICRRLWTLNDARLFRHKWEINCLIFLFPSGHIRIEMLEAQNKAAVILDKRKQFVKNRRAVLDQTEHSHHSAIAGRAPDFFSKSA